MQSGGGGGAEAVFTDTTRSIWNDLCKNDPGFLAKVQCYSWMRHCRLRIEKMIASKINISFLTKFRIIENELCFCESGLRKKESLHLCSVSINQVPGENIMCGEITNGRASLFTYILWSKRGEYQDENVVFDYRSLPLFILASVSFKSLAICW